MKKPLCPGDIRENMGAQHQVGRRLGLSRQDRFGEHCGGGADAAKLLAQVGIGLNGESLVELAAEPGGDFAVTCPCVYEDVAGRQPLPLVAGAIGRGRSAPRGEGDEQSVGVLFLATKECC